MLMRVRTEKAFKNAMFFPALSIPLFKLYC
jgi:hypothetical protein